jgi:hypothetical protein
VEAKNFKGLANMEGMPGDADLVRQTLLAAAGNREPGEDQGTED